MAELDIVTSSNDSCNCYGMSYSQESYLILHYRIHTRSKPFQCITYQKTFPEANSLKTHEVAHSGVRDLSPLTFPRFSLIKVL